MSILSAVFWGIIQGLGEFLPISSSGHLAIMQNIFGMESTDGMFTFNILLHLGTLIAVFIIYWHDIWELVPAFFGLISKIAKGKRRFLDWSLEERFCVLILVATLPLAIAVLLDDYVDILSGYTKIIGCILILNGCMLLFSDYIASLRRTVKSPGEIKPRHALFVGFIQLLAILPGLSRSGSTITGGLLMGFERKDAVKFSFILSIPAILGANIFSVGDIIKNPIASTDVAAYLAGMLAAMLVGIAAMKLLIYISKKSNFRFFGFYCMAAGLVAIIFG